jgi:hypothetical protein
MSIDNSSTSENEFVGIKGWLFYLTIGIVLVPPLLVFAIAQNLIDQSYSKIYSNSWLVPVTLLWNFIYLLAFSYAAFLLVKKKSRAKRILIHILWTYALTYVFFVNAQMIDANHAVAEGLITKEFADSWISGVGSDAGRATIAAFIWIPYLIRSKRVKVTLIN